VELPNLPLMTASAVSEGKSGCAAFKQLEAAQSLFANAFPLTLQSGGGYHPCASLNKVSIKLKKDFSAGPG
jgi:hypothetical protein